MSTAVFVNDVTKKFSNPVPMLMYKQQTGNGKYLLPAHADHLHQLVTAVDHATFTVHQGEIFGIYGPAGAGKSTLIRLLAALIQPDEGEIRVFGYDLAHQLRQAALLTNRISVEASFYKRLSVIENLLCGARLYGVNTAEARRYAQELLLRLGIDDSLALEPMEMLSRQKLRIVSIAQSLLSRPRLLLLDDKICLLDDQIKDEVIQIILKLRHEYGVTTLITSRNADELPGLCDRWMAMEDGKVLLPQSASSFYGSTIAGPMADELVNIQVDEIEEQEYCYEPG